MRRITLKLTERADGRFAKKIDGRYFIWPDEETARKHIIELARKREQGDADTTAPHVPTDPPLRIIANRFHEDRQPAVLPTTWSDYETAIDQFLASAGKHRSASSLRPTDFAAIRKKWAANLGPWKIDSRVQAVRTMFNWAVNTARLIPQTPWYGDSFSKTTAAEKRQVQREKIAAHGVRVFAASELRKIMAEANGSMLAFVLLGMNGGMYGADIARLRKTDLRREGQCWLIDNDRFKTGVWRRFVLWPETIKAIAAAKDTSDSELLFLTEHGNPWVNGQTHSVTLMFGRMLRDLEIKRGGVNFGSLRHTHVSAVGDHPDINAARLVRGHKFSGIEVHYDFPNLKRIKAVTDLARRRLLTTARPALAKKARSAPHASRRQRTSDARSA